MTKVYLFVKSTPLMVNFVRFQELMYVPRLLDFQHRLPVPSKVKGAVMVEFTGLQVLPPLVVVAVGGTGVLVDPTGVCVGGTKVGVFVAPTGVGPPLLLP